MRKIGKLNGKTVVQGDPNLITNNQILYKENNDVVTLKERKK